MTTRFGTLQTLKEHGTAEKAGGLDVAMVELDMSFWQPTHNGSGVGVQNTGAYPDNIKSTITTLQAAGLKVSIGLGLHKPPDWMVQYWGTEILYRNQLGNYSTGAVNGYGSDALDYTWSSKARQLAEAYISQVKAHLGAAVFNALDIRSAFGNTGEDMAPQRKSGTVQVQTYVTDSFTRSDTTSTLGISPVAPTWTSTVGSTWVNLAGNFGVSNNQAYCFSGPGSARVEAGVANLEATAVLAVLPSSTSSYMGLLANNIDAANTYFADVNSAGAMRLFKTVGGTSTSLGTATGFVAGDTLSIIVSATDVIAKRNGTTVITGVPDAALAAGTGYGLRFSSTTPSVARWDNFTVTDSFVPSSNYDWWANSPKVQSGAAGLATGTTVAPNVGPPSGATQVTAWLDWYMASAAARSKWFVDFLCRSTASGGLGFLGFVQIVTPGSGVRPSAWSTLRAASSLSNGHLAGVQAVWHVLYEAHNSSTWASRVRIHCSSMADGSGSNTPPQAGDDALAIDSTTANSWGSARWMRFLRNKFTNLGGLTAENPGLGSSGYGTAMLSAAFSIMSAGGWDEFYYAHEKDLWSDDGTAAVIPVQTYYDSIATYRTTETTGAWAVIGIGGNVTAGTPSWVVLGVGGSVTSTNGTWAVIGVSGSVTAGNGTWRVLGISGSVEAAGETDEFYYRENSALYALDLYHRDGNTLTLISSGSGPVVTPPSSGSNETVSLAAFSFTNLAASTSATPPPTAVDASVSITSITPGVGLNPIEVFTTGGYSTGNVIRVSTAATSTPGNTVGNQAYFAFTVSPTGTDPIDLVKLELKGARGGTSTVRGFLIRTSIDNYATDLVPATDLVNARPTWNSFSYDLNDLPVINGPVTFRIYIYNNVNGGTLEFDDIIVTGSRAPLVIEPVSSYDPDDESSISIPAGYTKAYYEGFDIDMAEGEITYGPQGVLTNTAAAKYSTSWRTYGNVSSTHDTKVYAITEGEPGYVAGQTNFHDPVVAKWRADKTVSVKDGYLIVNQNSQVINGVLTSCGAAIVPILGDGSDSEYMTDPFFIVEFSIQSYEVMRAGVDLALARDVTSGLPLGYIRVPLLIASDWWPDGSETDFPDGEHNRPTAGTYIDAFPSLRNHKVYPSNSMPYDKQIWRYVWEPDLMRIYMNGTLVYTATGSNVPSDPQAFVMQLEANWRQAAETSSAKSRIGYIFVAKPTVPWTFAADTFAGAANSATLGASTGAGTPSWVNRLGVWGKDGTGKAQVITGPALATLECGKRGHAVTFTLDALPSTTTAYAGIVTRYVDASNHYWVDFNSAGAGRVFKIVDGVETQLGTLAAGSVAVGQSIKIKHQGFWITVYRNGVKIFVVKSRETRDTYEEEVIANRKARNGTSIGLRASSATGVASVRFSNLKVTSA